MLQALLQTLYQVSGVTLGVAYGVHDHVYMRLFGKTPKPASDWHGQVMSCRQRPVLAGLRRFAAWVKSYNSLMRLAGPV